FFHIAGAHQRFFFSQLGKGAILALGFQFAQTANRNTNSFVVGQHTTQPAVAYKRLTSAFGLLFDGLLRCTLGAHKQNLFLLCSHLLNKSQGFVKGRNGFFEVDNVNLVTRAKDVAVHLRVPVTGLVTKVDTSGQHVAHAYLWHSSFPVWVKPPYTPSINPRAYSLRHPD